MSSCASAPRIGVRSGFEDHRVPQIAIAPLWSSSHFGVDAAQWRGLEAEVLREITTELESMGFVIVDPAELRDQLERRRAWGDFMDILDFEDGLDRRFEPSLYAAPTAEVAGLQALAAGSALDVSAVLFTEIVYHSRGTCSVDSRDHSRFAVVVDRAGAEVDARSSSPCIVTHLQAKLVDPKTAATMWHNRVLRELRAAQLQESDDAQNASLTAVDVVAGTYGLQPFAPNPDGDALARN